MEPTQPERPGKRKAFNFKLERFRPSKRSQTVANGTSTFLAAENEDVHAVQHPLSASSATGSSLQRLEGSVMEPSPSPAPPTTHHDLSVEGDGPSGHMKSATRAEKAWSTFKTILPIIEKVSVVFPPLQSATGGLIQAIAAFDVRSNAGVDENDILIMFPRGFPPTFRSWKSSIKHWTSCNESSLPIP